MIASSIYLQLNANVASSYGCQTHVELQQLDHLAAILLKILDIVLRFSIPMFPAASEYFTPLVFSLSIIAIIYTSLVALMQDDMKS